jgi:CheY-like chemotaxis protein
VQKSPLVLIVDDLQSNIKVVGETLKIDGYRITAATSGKQAIHLCQKLKPDLILMDVMMPEMNGYETCKEIKKLKNCTDIPIIFLTAKNNTEDLVEAFDAGGVDFITKPFKALELLARVKLHIELLHAKREIKTLKGFLPVCASCKSIRDDSGDWVTLERYLQIHTDVELTHGLCPKCLKDLYPEYSDDE